VDEAGPPWEVRVAVRALLLTPQEEVLLLECEVPGKGLRLWETPGGAIGPGETPEAALRREVWEETGHHPGAIGPRVWTRRHRFEFLGRRLDQRETFYLVPTERFEPVPTENPAAIERDAFRGFRWWTPPEIAASDAVFVPRALARHLDALLTAALPTTPIDVGL
jgi:8-oxo-dGTP diphosphatase